MLEILGKGVKILKKCKKTGLVALYKPPTVLSHPNRYGQQDECLLNTPFDARSESYNSVNGNVFLCHRLDKGTSGVILVSERRETANEIKELFRKRDVRKEYVALCHGRNLNFPQDSLWVDDVMIHREEDGSHARCVAGKGMSTKKASTTILGVSQGFFSLGGAKVPILRVDMSPHSGVTHQLRYQLSSRGFPIMHDNLYHTRATGLLGKLINEEENGSCGRLMLHSMLVHIPSLEFSASAELCLATDMEVVMNRAGLSTARSK